jgi:hypothetical protein
MCIWQNEAKIMKLIKGKPLNDSWCAEAIPALLEKASNVRVTPALKSEKSRAGPPKRKSIWAACVTRAIGYCPMH